MATFDGSSSSSFYSYGASAAGGSEEIAVDMSNEYTCFLCNGFQTVIGTIALDAVGITLTNALGIVLEYDSYDEIMSINELEPVNTHSLLIVFPQRYVMMCYLLRKSKLVETFKDLGLYQEEPKIPPEAIGFYKPEILGNQRKLEEHMEDITLEEETSYHPQRVGGRETGHSQRRNARHVRQEDEEDDQWSNKKEQERHVQREISRQSALNNVQILSSADQERKRVMSGDWMQLEKYPSTIKHSKKEEKDAKRTVSTPPDAIVSPPTSPIMQGTPPSVASLQGTSQLSDKVSSAKLDQLKMLFPDRSEDSLMLSLKVCQYSVDETVNYILSKDELASRNEEERKRAMPTHYSTTLQF